MSGVQAERQLILLSASTAACRQAMQARAGRLLRDVDWSRLVQTLRTRKLLTTLGPRILELTGDFANDELAEAVERALEAGRRQGAFLQMVTLRIVALLADAGIRCASLKGPLLGEAIYGDPGRRLSSDIDLLVPAERLTQAVEVVRGLGYGASTDHVLEDGLPLLHFMLADEREKLPPVELHWRVHWYERDFARERLLPPEIDWRAEWHPALADELAALLLFYARDGFVDLRMASDLSAWWDVHGADLPSGVLADLLDAYPALARSILAAAWAAERVVGLPAQQIVGDARNLDLRERVAVRLANPNPRSGRSQLYADMGLIDGLLSPPCGLGAFTRRQLLPPSEVRDKQAQHRSRRRRRSSIGRSVGMLGRYCLTMTRLLRTSETLG